MDTSAQNGMAELASERREPVTDLSTIYASYCRFCQRIGHNPPSYEQWERDRKRTDAGWKLNYIG